MEKNFPFATTLDFSPLVDFWRTHAEDPKSRWYSLAQTVLDQVQGVPELNGPLDDPERLQAVRGGVELLMSAFMSPSNEHLAASAMVPWHLKAAYSTELARTMELPERMAEHFDRTYSSESMYVSMMMKAYGFVLSEVYDIDLGFELPFSWVSFRDVENTVPIECPQSGIKRRFAIDVDTRFIRVEVMGERPEISPEEVLPLASDPNCLPRLMELLPPDRFAFRGLTMLFANDVTAESALTAIREDLLVKDALTSSEGVIHIQEHVRAFIGRADLDLGLIGIEEGSDVDAITEGQVIGRSLLMSDGSAPWCPNRTESLYAQAVRLNETVFVDDLFCCDIQTGFEYKLQQQGLHSLMILPLHVEGALVGVLELGSKTPGALKSVNVFKLEKLEAVFALGLRRSMAEREDQVQSIIKREYTAIHPVVEWRFRQAARERIRKGEAAPAEEIVFQGLNPLYGLTDIRGSSDLRNAAISADLREQLVNARDVICAAQSAKPQPALGEVEFRINRYLDSLHPGMATEDESSVLDYLQRQVEPLFGRVEQIHDIVATAVATYREALDDDLGIVYRERKDFELSVGTVNETIASVLRAREVEGQALVPHYFEMFKTDGVDYNIYLGESLHQDRPHDPLDLSNLRLWQLITQVEIQWGLTRASDALRTPLDVTHLILAQNTPLAIRFRRDEHRFDVDGAYNIRYEIVKKRIDKALVRGTGERLTQPGMIAIAYSQEREAREYRRNIEYLQSSGHLEPDIETLELEDLQGVFGLKAIRVRIAPAQQATDAESSGEEPTTEKPRLSLEA
jgi:GAF domain-containing protein